MRYGKTLEMLLNAVHTAKSGGRVVFYTTDPASMCERAMMLASELGLAVASAHATVRDAHLSLGTGTIAFTALGAV